MQKFIDLFISTDALNVSGGSSDHHQEHITVHTASDIVNRYCCLLLSWMRWNTVPSHPGYRPATSWVHYTTSCNTQSSAPEDGQNSCPKHDELIGIINKPLLLHLVGCLYYQLSSHFRNTDVRTERRRNFNRSFADI
jgi:hypothetical protein